MPRPVQRGSTARAASPTRWSRRTARLCPDDVLPALAPREVLARELLDRGAEQMMFEAPPRRHVTDEEHALPVPPGQKVGQHAADARDRLPPRLAVRVRRVEKGRAVV